MTQIDGAKRIAPYIKIENNISYSFNVFVDTVKRMANTEKQAEVDERRK